MKSRNQLVKYFLIHDFNLPSFLSCLLNQVFGRNLTSCEIVIHSFWDITAELMVEFDSLKWIWSTQDVTSLSQKFFSRWRCESRLWILHSTARWESHRQLIWMFLGSLHWNRLLAECRQIRLVTQGTLAKELCPSLANKKTRICRRGPKADQVWPGAVCVPNV